MDPKRYNLFIATWLEPELVDRIRQVDPRLNVIYRSDLVGVPRYPADHYNPAVRTAQQEAEWLGLLAKADILFDFDPNHRPDLPDLAPNVVWLQASSAGIGQTVARHDYHKRWPGTVFTTGSGMHGIPLAEFAMMSILAHSRGLFRMLDEQRRHAWGRYAMSDVTGRTVGIIGVGRIGREVACRAKAFGMVVLGCNSGPAMGPVDECYEPEDLEKILPRAEYLVISVPHTPQTEKMVGARQIAMLPPGAAIVNIGRGPVVDEQAMIAALHSGHLGGAYLDVFEVEPLPADSPLWDMPNVLISPHSAGTSDRENPRLVDLFCDNLARFLNGQPLRNVLDPERMY